MSLRPSLRSNAVGDAEYCFFRSSSGFVDGVEISLACVGRETCLPQYRVTPTGGQYYALEFVAAGKGMMGIPPRYELAPGTIFSYAFESSEVVRTDRTHPMLRYFATYTIEGARWDYSSSLMWPGSRTTVRYSPDIRATASVFDAILEEGKRPRKSSLNLAYRSLDLIALKAQRVGSAPRSEETLAAARYRKAMKCIEDHYLELSGLADLSARLEFESTLLCKTFKQFGAETPHRCIAKLKLNHAARLLHGDSLPIRDVARAVGINDPFYFSRVFRSYFGVPPSAFRYASLPLASPLEPAAVRSGMNERNQLECV